MTREEAIACFERQCASGICTEADEMALAALRDQESKDTNVPTKWISVKDKLPKEWKEKGGDLINYLVFMPEYGVDVGNYAKPVKTWLCMGVPCKVTHWMPLPEPPEVPEQ